MGKSIWFRFYDYHAYGTPLSPEYREKAYWSEYASQESSTHAATVQKEQGCSLLDRLPALKLDNHCIKTKKHTLSWILDASLISENLDTGILPVSILLLPTINYF